MLNKMFLALLFIALFKYSNCVEIEGQKEISCLQEKIIFDSGTIVCVIITFESNLFEKSLVLLKDSMYAAFNCDEIDFVRVLIDYNDEDTIISLLPRPIGFLDLSFYAAKMINNRNPANSVRFLFFNIKNILFQINESDFLKLNLDYKVLGKRYEINSDKWKTTKSKRCKRRYRKLYQTTKAVLKFRLHNDQINEIKFESVNKI